MPTRLAMARGDTIDISLLRYALTWSTFQSGDALILEKAGIIPAPNIPRGRSRYPQGRMHPDHSIPGDFPAITWTVVTG